MVSAEINTTTRHSEFCRAKGPDGRICIMYANHVGQKHTPNHGIEGDRWEDLDTHEPYEKYAIATLVAVSADDFKSETGGFKILLDDLNHIFPHSHLPSLVSAIYDRSVELGKNLQILGEECHNDPYVHVTWKPSKVLDDR